ncbi:GrpB family protein [Fictibacillus aquaticus]|uniref:GrpB family protein n=1 Tax=Fictibacillus aquaticus TaxID=2021314 RepID=A0A235FDP0_9BACL|nr:GrpB family protein [Fictibacillus aquaticus]OYD59359.1 hypothetical protein CGZ90_05575 [Fictibacillus aquaticus]
MRKVEVLPFSKDWKKRFEEEAQQLRNVFGDLIIAIHHIGSTSIPGLAAKPVIDILPVVNDIEAVDRYNEQMVQMGYEPRGEYGISGRRYFPKGGNERTHHVHAYEDGSPEIERHLAFRDYLSTHETEREQYSTLKLELAKQFPHDIESYIKGKHELAQSIDTRASEWYKKQQAR